MARKHIRITDEACRAIRSLAIHDFRNDATKNPDGSWMMPIDQEVAERIEKNRHPGETVSDALIRFCAFYRSRGRAH
jgi:hypothetical protein